MAPKHALRALVRAYRYFVSPLLPQACRFHPSCSAYAEQALQEHGALCGGWLSARRGTWASTPVVEPADDQLSAFGLRTAP